MGWGTPAWQVSCPLVSGLPPALLNGGLTLPVPFHLQVLFLSLGA